MIRRQLGSLASRLAPQLVGSLEHLWSARRGDAWGGPFNGQQERRAIFAALGETIAPDAIVETGTFRGSTTSYLATQLTLPILSSELNPRFFAFARRRLRHHRHVRLHREDSRTFLRGLDLAPTATPLCYLDAHWNDDLPLAEEVDILFGRFARCVAMVDDFEVPDDAGYGFDDYGPGKRLSLRDFHFHRDRRLVVYFPRARASEETGARRGCAVLASPALAPRLDALRCLRRAGAAV